MQVQLIPTLCVGGLAVYQRFGSITHWISGAPFEIKLVSVPKTYKKLLIKSRLLETSNDCNIYLFIQKTLQQLSFSESLSFLA